MLVFMKVFGSEILWVLCEVENSSFRVRISHESFPQPPASSGMLVCPLECQSDSFQSVNQQPSTRSRLLPVWNTEIKDHTTPDPHCIEGFPEGTNQQPVSVLIQ